MLKDEAILFNIDTEQIEQNNKLFENIDEAISEMREQYYKENLEVILNKNLISVKNKLTGIKTIFGCKVTFEDLENDISFIVRNETKIEGILSKVERAILESIDKTYKWIARDEFEEWLFLYEDKPIKDDKNRWINSERCISLELFKHLFQFITWQDDEPYKIEELLKE